MSFTNIIGEVFKLFYRFHYPYFVMDVETGERTSTGDMAVNRRAQV